jgi:hypothetical protein
MFNRQLALAYGLTAGFCFLIAFKFALGVSPVYKTDALLIPKEQTGASQLSGSLASASKLLGIGGVGDHSSNFSKFQKYWGSRDVAQQIVTKYPGLMRKMFSSNWDTAHNRWYDHPHTLQQIVAIPLNWMFGVYPSYAPAVQDLATYIKGAMALDYDETNEEIHVTYSAPDAKFAQWFIATVISQTDQAVRDAEQRRDQDFINFSRNRLERETNVSYRDALTDSVRQFEISNMYSEAGDNFSFQYVEAPALPINHSAPRPLTYTVLAFIFANLMAACLVGAMMLWPQSALTRRVNVATGWLTACTAPYLGGQRQRRTT